MKHTLIFVAPMKEGEHPGAHPSRGETRFENLRTICRDYGLLDASTGKVAKKFRLYRGSYPPTLGTPHGWFAWRMEWEEMDE